MCIRDRYGAAGNGISSSGNSEIIDNIISYSQNRYTNCYQSQNGNYLWGINIQGDHNVLRGNMITNFATGIRLNGFSDNIIDSNTIHTVSSITNNVGNVFNYQNNLYGINAQNCDSLFITNNTITTESGDVIYQTNGASTIKYNLLETESGRGIWCENQAGVEFSNNTLVSTNGTGDYGMHISNLSAPIIKNNIIDNFQNGIYVDNTVINYAIQYNDIWNIGGSEYSGSALPPLIGSYNSCLLYTSDAADDC